MLKIRINGVETQVHSRRWEGGITPAGTAKSNPTQTGAHHDVSNHLLDLDETALELVGADLQEPFQVLLELLICSGSGNSRSSNPPQQQCDLLQQGHLPTDTELLDQVMALASCFQLEELVENIANALLEQEEARIANAQCLKCGVNHPDFCLISRELCDHCSRRTNEVDRCDKGEHRASSTANNSRCWVSAVDNFLAAHQEDVASHVVTSPGMNYGHGLGDSISF